MDFDESSNKIVTREFTAVVLAGFGTEYVFLYAGSDTADARILGFFLSQAIKAMNHLPKHYCQLQINRWSNTLSPG